MDLIAVQGGNLRKMRSELVDFEVGIASNLSVISVVLNESQKLSIDDAIPKVERVGRGFTTRLVDKNDPYILRQLA